LVRLETHTAAFRFVCDDASDEPAGKKMEFLVQEILREATTLGNKCRGLEISPRVIELKHTIEKIREQVANVE
jgi:uncharacterized protein (TIGR00255 family)